MRKGRDGLGHRATSDVSTWHSASVGSLRGFPHAAINIEVVHLVALPQAYQHMKPL